MKKFFMFSVLVVVMMISASSLMAYPNLYWHVSSDHTCNTVFYVSEHPDYSVVVTRIRCDVNGIPYSWAAEQDVLTFGTTTHYYTYSWCPNFRSLYRAYYILPSGTRVLASTQLFVIRPNSSIPPNTFCNQCADTIQPIDDDDNAVK